MNAIASTAPPDAPTVRWLESLGASDEDVRRFLSFFKTRDALTRANLARLAPLLSLTHWLGDLILCGPDRRAFRKAAIVLLDRQKLLVNRCLERADKAALDFTEGEAYREARENCVREIEELWRTHALDLSALLADVLGLPVEGGAPCE